MLALKLWHRRRRIQEKEDTGFPDDAHWKARIASISSPSPDRDWCQVSQGEGRRLEEKSASPALKERRTEVKEEEEEKKMLEGKIKEEGVRCNSVGAPAAGSTLFFSLMSFQSDVSPQSSHTILQVLPFFLPCFPPPNMPCYNFPQCSQMPWLQWVICGACQSWGTLLPCAVLTWDALPRPCSCAMPVCIYIRCDDLRFDIS